MDYYLDTVYPILIGAFSWSTLYFILCLINAKRSYEWNIRMLTLIHGILVTVLGGYGILVLGPWPFTHSGGPTTTYQQFVISISLSYFLLDFSWCLYFRTEGPMMLLHHTLSIAGLGTSYVLGKWGTELVTTILGAEITNPLLQLRWFLKETGQYDSITGDIVDVAFMVSFGVFRIVIGSYLLYTYYQQDTDFLGRFGGTIIYLIGWLFWISIVKYGIKKYNRKYGKKRASKENTANVNGNKSKTKAEVNGNLVDKSTDSTHMNGNVVDKSTDGTHMNGNLHKRHINGIIKAMENDVENSHDML